MSEPSDTQKKIHPLPDAETIDKAHATQDTLMHQSINVPLSAETFRKTREALMQQFSEHTSGVHPLPPQESLALRSHITRITEIVEPGTKEMWPDYSSAESAYLAEQAAKNKRAANEIGIAALGPVAGSPAILAKALGAPENTVENFLELGFNLAAAKSLKNVGMRDVSSLEAIKAMAELEALRNPKVVRSESSNSHNEPSIRAGITQAEFMNSMREDLQEAKPLLDWYNKGKNHPLGKFDDGELAVVIRQYGGLNAEIIAEVHSAQSIETALKEYRAPGNHLRAIEDVHKFSMDVVDAITTDGIINPAKLKTVIKEIKAGEFMITTDNFAALEHARNLYHENYIKTQITGAVGMARSAGISDETYLANIATQTRDNAEQKSPYQPPKDSDHDLTPHDKGTQR